MLQGMDPMMLRSLQQVYQNNPGSRRALRPAIQQYPAIQHGGGGMMGGSIFDLLRQRMGGLRGQQFGGVPQQLSMMPGLLNWR